MATPFQRNFPNALTVARLVFSIAFFAALSLYQFPDTRPVLLDVALFLFMVAAVTDWLDGALARKWEVTSVFGRIMDPVCDKVLVIGAFVFLAGPMFSYDPAAYMSPSPMDIPRPNLPAFRMISGVYPWMVVLILGRELLVTAIRGLMEAQGVAFGASWSGKAKMILQSIVVPILIFVIGHANPIENAWVAVVRDVLVGLTLLVTVSSGWPYIAKTISVVSAEQSA